MNEEHAMEILEALSDWFESNSSTPIHGGALLFSDEHTLEEHIQAALSGVASEGME